MVRKPVGSSDKAKAKRRECKKLSMRKAREKLKLNPELLEEARKKDRERKKEQRKSIKEMNDREQRHQRKNWRKYSKTYRDNLKKTNAFNIMLECDTPPSSPSNNMNNSLPSTSRVKSGKKKRRENREKMKRTIRSLNDKNRLLEKELAKYKKRVYRMSKSIDTTPIKNVRNILKGRKCSNDIKKRLIFGETLQNQLRKNFIKEKNVEKKRYIAQMVSGKIVKKSKFLNKISKDIVSRRCLSYVAPLTNNQLKKKVKFRKDVQCFLEQDENSKQLAGKKETITKNKIKMQRRLLNDSLKNLHKKFIVCFPEYLKMSYSEFCKYKPFWILIPNCQNRDTCLCKVHCNMSFIVTKLHNLQMIDERNLNDILINITCEGKLLEDCLDRKCNTCKHKEIKMKEFHENDTINYNQWIDKKVEIELKGEKKLCKRTEKAEITTTKKGLVDVFKQLLPRFSCHVRNIRHQYKAIKHVKESLKTNEVLVHMDFSENYNLKYNEEVQSFHFGGSRNQASLHTSILYYCVEKDLGTKQIPFCTISESRRHDSVSICAHLKPLISEILKIVPDLETIHFLSDGPSSQYRNRKMFVLAAKVLAKQAKVENLHWHYLESGHGKGAADGVGGCLKRTADSIVAHGTDIPTVNVLVQILQEHCKGIKIIYVAEQDILKFDNIEVFVPAFKGTLKTHEITWSKKKIDVIQVRSLTCISCSPGEKCQHYNIGQMNIRNTNCILLYTILFYFNL